METFMTETTQTRTATRRSFSKSPPRSSTAPCLPRRSIVRRIWTQNSWDHPSVSVTIWDR